jgi:hypothetical protein
MHDTGCRMSGYVFDFPASHYFAAASAGTNSMRCRSRRDLPISVILNAVLNLFQDLFQNCFRISYYQVFGESANPPTFPPYTPAMGLGSAGFTPSPPDFFVSASIYMGNSLFVLKCVQTNGTKVLKGGT